MWDAHRKITQKIIKLLKKYNTPQGDAMVILRMVEEKIKAEIEKDIDRDKGMSVC